MAKVRHVAVMVSDAKRLRDCYVEWREARVRVWSDHYRQRWCVRTRHDVSAERWQRWFDLMGLQRHLKVLGIFCRLWYRDGKRGYLADLPLVLRYTLNVAMRYPELREFAEWLRARVGEGDITRPVERIV